MNRAEKDFYRLARLRAYDPDAYARTLRKMAENAAAANAERREKRRAQRDPAKNAAFHKKWYAKHRDEICAKNRAAYAALTPEERKALIAKNREERARAKARKGAE